MKIAFAIAFSLGCVAFAQAPSGTISIAKASRVFISSCGQVKLTGEDRPDIAYTIAQRRGNATLVVKTPDSETLKLWLKPSNSETSPELELHVPRALFVTMESSGGDLIVSGLDNDLIAKTVAGRILLDKLSRSATVKTGGGEIRVGQVGGALKCFSMGGSIHVTSAGAAYFETGGGEIFLREANGPVIAKTAGGNIHIVRAKSRVDANTAGGVIDVTHADGPVVASTGGGSIQVTAAKGAKCDTAVGAIRLKGVTGALHATTGSGSILAELPAASPLEDSVLRTARGDVIVLIPSNLAVTVKAAGQKIVSDFPAIPGAAMRASGDINGGGPLLKIEAIGGVVYLRRRQ